MNYIKTYDIIGINPVNIKRKAKALYRKSIPGSLDVYDSTIMVGDIMCSVSLYDIFKLEQICSNNINQCVVSVKAISKKECIVSDSNGWITIY